MTSYSIYFANWDLSIKNSGYAYARIQKNFMFGYFPFNQSKNNVFLEPKIGHFQGLVGFQAKKLGFEAKAKDFKMCPRGQGRLRGLHRCTFARKLKRVKFDRFF